MLTYELSRVKIWLWVGGGVGWTNTHGIEGLRHYSGNVLIHNVLFHLATVHNSPK